MTNQEVFDRVARFWIKHLEPSEKDLAELRRLAEERGLSTKALESADQLTAEASVVNQTGKQS